MTSRPIASVVATVVATISLLAGLAPWSLRAAAEETRPPRRAKYVRLERDPAGELVALQTSVVRFVANDDPQQAGLAVDLVGAVHVGDKVYYEALNKRFEGYDVVLYELVAPPGTRIPKGARPGNHPIAMLQGGIKNMLGLEHQLQIIDYTKDNMVHADMSPDEFSKSMSDRGESFMTMMARMMGQAIAQQSQQKNKTGEFDLLAALFASDRAGSLKRIMAEQLEGVEGAMDALDGPQGSTLVSERNKVALKRLAEAIAAGKKKIAIFYGAGHMNDFEKRLAADFQLKRSSEDWLTAWNLARKPAPGLPSASTPAAR